jgi:hypothetical protein
VSNSRPNISTTRGVVTENSSDSSSGRRLESKSDEFSVTTPLVVEIISILVSRLHGDDVSSYWDSRSAYRSTVASVTHAGRGHKCCCDPTPLGRGAAELRPRRLTKDWVAEDRAGRAHHEPIMRVRTWLERRPTRPSFDAVMASLTAHAIFHCDCAATSALLPCPYYRISRT